MHNPSAIIQNELLEMLKTLSAPEPSKRIYTTDEAAAYLDLHPETLKKRARAGLINPLPNFKRPLRFTREELDRYLMGSTSLSGTPEYQKK